MGLILDSSFVITSERRGGTAADLFERILAVAGDENTALSAIGLTELVHGVDRAQTPQVRARRERFIQDLLNTLEVYPYTREAALIAGKVDGEQRNQGIVIPFNDLLIGATALSIGYSVLTANPRHFRMIPGLTVLEV